MRLPRDKSDQAAIEGVLSAAAVEIATLVAGPNLFDLLHYARALLQRNLSAWLSEDSRIEAYWAVTGVTISARWMPRTVPMPVAVPTFSDFLIREPAPSTSLKTEYWPGLHAALLVPLYAHPAWAAVIPGDSRVIRARSSAPLEGVVGTPPIRIRLWEHDDFAQRMRAKRGACG